MLVPDVLFSFIIALISSFAASFIISRQVPRKGFLLFFLVIFLGTWAGGIWGKTLSLSVWLRSWFPFLISGIFAALLFSWLAPQPPQVNRQSVLDRKDTLEMLDEVEQQKEVEKIAHISVNIFFCVVLLLLLTAIVLHYI